MISTRERQNKPIKGHAYVELTGSTKEHAMRMMMHEKAERRSPVLVTALILVLSACGCNGDSGDTDTGPVQDQGPDGSAVQDLTADSQTPDSMTPDMITPDQAIPDLPPPSCTDKVKNGDETRLYHGQKVRSAHGLHQRDVRRGSVCRPHLHRWSEKR